MTAGEKSIHNVPEISNTIEGEYSLLGNDREINYYIAAIAK
jgi:hypothetical protein